MNLQLIAFFVAVVALAVWIKFSKKKDDVGKRKKTDGDNDKKARGYVAPNRYETLAKKSGDHDLKSLCVALRRAFERSVGGAVVCGPRKALGIEFDGPRGDDGVKVQFVVAPNEERAKQFLRGETTETVMLPDKVFEEFRKYLLGKSHSNGGEVDVGSGCATHTGYIVPPS